MSVTATSRLASVSTGRDPPTVVWLRGEHDRATVGELSATIARAIAVDHADLVVDLSDVEFMDTATVGVLVRAQIFLRFRSRSLTLRSPSHAARRTLDACGLSPELTPRQVP